MDIDDFLTLARKRRSTRFFKPDPVPGGYIDKILEAGRWAMSGGNAQPWEFIVITHKEIKDRLAKAYLWLAETGAKIELTRLPEYTHPKYSLTQPTDVSSSIIWSDAPVIIAVLGNARTMQASNLLGRFYEEHTFTNNLAIATNMLHLAAAALGLGAQWITILQPVGEMMKPILGIPPEFTLFTLVPIGYPAKPLTQCRRELNEMVHFETYDMAKFRSEDDIQEFVRSLRRSHRDAGSYPKPDKKGE